MSYEISAVSTLPRSSFMPDMYDEYNGGQFGAPIEDVPQKANDDSCMCFTDPCPCHNGYK